MKFPGFKEAEPCSPIPDGFFRHLLGEIQQLDELKLTLYALWRMGNMEGGVHMLREEDFRAVIAEPGPALQLAVQRGSLLEVRRGAQSYYFLNSPHGRAAARSLEDGRLKPEAILPTAPPPERPNIFRLYEENIGPLTPLLADMLRNAEQDYPEEWLAEALTIAVKNNKRNWRYVEAILKRWKEQERDETQDREDSRTRGKEYTQSQFDEYLE